MEDLCATKTKFKTQGQIKTELKRKMNQIRDLSTLSWQLIKQLDTNKKIKYLNGINLLDLSSIEHYTEELGNTHTLCKYIQDVHQDTLYAESKHKSINTPT